jgi:hypothetical protein
MGTDGGGKGDSPRGIVAMDQLLGRLWGWGDLGAIWRGSKWWLQAMSCGWYNGRRRGRPDGAGGATIRSASDAKGDGGKAVAMKFLCLSEWESFLDLHSFELRRRALGRCAVQRKDGLGVAALKERGRIDLEWSCTEVAQPGMPG